MKRLGFLAAFLLFATPLRARIHAADSLEWLVDSSDDILQVKVNRTEDAWKEGDEGARADYQTIQATQVKSWGSAPEKHLWTFKGRLYSGPWPPEKDRPLLLFCRGMEPFHVIDLGAPEATTADFKLLATREAVLESKDEGKSVVQRGEGKMMRPIPTYPARQVAYETLLKLGEQVEKPEGYRDDLEPSLFYFGD